MRELDLLLPEWPAPPNVRAAASTRHGGVSKGAFAEFNLGMHVGDETEAVAANRRRLSARLGLASEPAWLQQVHGVNVVEARAGGAPVGADASWTCDPGVVCAILTADCLPILLCDSAGRWVGAVHGGWRSLAGGIIGKLVSTYPGKAADLLAWLGPAIGRDAFEVGPEVRGAFVSEWPDVTNAFRSGTGDRWLCDIYNVARAQLRAAGVTAVFGGDRCTFHEPKTFFSYRRDGSTGRMASLIWLGAAVAE